MANVRRLAGGALIGIGVAVSLMTLRTATGARAEAEAAVRAGAEAAAARSAEAQRAAEARVRDATSIPALTAALNSHVDGATLIDLFDSEDWWIPYRTDFALVRVIVGNEILAARGRLPLGTRDAGVVELARKHEAASAQVTIDGQHVLVAAARVKGADAPDPDAAPVLVLARPLVTTGTPTVRVPELADHAPYWALAGGMGLCGIGLLLSGGRARRPVSGNVAGEIPTELSGEIVHETTAKMGSLGNQPSFPSYDNPPPVADGAPAWTDGAPVRVPGGGQMPAVPASPVSTSAPTMMAMSTSPSPPPAMKTALFTMAVPPAGGPAPGALPFGRYRLRDRLGEGGMSEIFLADGTGAEGFKRTFVVKRLRAELARDAAAVGQFVDEARLQASIVHPNIVAVLDFGVIDSEYFMAQEYVAGRDLAKLLARYQGTGGAPLPTSVGYYVVHETLQALAYAHEMTDRNGAPLGIVHRDISVGNLLVSLQGEVKLIDFGIVMSNDRVTKTQVGMVKGNANFMSPEQARGRVVDSRSDLFSMGLVLYYALTGQMLYGAGNDLGVLYQATNGPTPADYARIRGLPEPAAAILDKALAFDPDERFQSAGEFADALAAHTSGGKAIVAKLMQRLFGDEIRRESA